MTKLEYLAEQVSENRRWEAFEIATNECPSDYGLENKYECYNEDGTMQTRDCVKCWLDEVKNDNERT